MLDPLAEYVECPVRTWQLRSLSGWMDGWMDVAGPHCPFQVSDGILMATANQW